jgi:hypothetical protein
MLNYASQYLFVVTFKIYLNFYDIVFLIILRINDGFSIILP